MKKITLLAIVLFTISQFTNAQAPDTLWTKTLGGTSYDYAQSVQQTNDGSFVIAGYTQSIDGDVFDNHGSSDFWVVRLNNNGDTLWCKTFGGTSIDEAFSIQQTFDSGFVLAGYSFSGNGDVHGNHGGYDYWIIKLNSNADTIWEKCYGGSKYELAYSIQQTYDSGFVVAGNTHSNDGDIHGYHGEEDFWVVKLNNSGDTIWTKALGGIDFDYAQSIQQTYDSGYVVAGYSKSVDGDVHGNHGDDDFWIVRLNSSGDTLWTRSYGGSSQDRAYSIQQTYDSGFVVAGRTFSTDGDVHGNHGAPDFWVIKLNNSGDTLWTKCLGSSGYEYAKDIQQTVDSGFVVTGRRNSKYWIEKLDENGNSIWTKALGGSSWDEAQSIQQNYDGGFIVAGYSSSNDGDVHGHQGLNDYWIVRLEGSLCMAPTDQTETNITATSVDLGWTENGSATAWEIMMDTAGFDTTGYAPATIITNPYFWDSLSSNTNYNWYVRSDCGGTQSEWTGPHIFTTICDIKQTPFVEDFTSDTLPDCWSMTGTPGWQFSTGAGDGAAGAGDHTPGGGTNYAWVDAPYLPGPLLTTPYININSLINPTIEFWYYCKRTNTNSENELKVEFWDGNVWNTIFNQLVNQPHWQHVLIDLSAYSIAGDVQFRFLALGDPMMPGNGDLLIDDILVDEYPSCPPVISMFESITENQVHLGWKELGSATTWQIMLDTMGFDTTAFVPVSVVSNPYTWNGLTENSYYDWYVRAYCGGGDQSEWTGPQTFQFISKPWLYMQNTLGGSSWDNAYSIQQTFDSGYVVAGNSFSNDWDVSGNHGDTDFWIVKLNNNGDTNWTKTYGGSLWDKAYSIQQTYDSGYIVAGAAHSIDGDVHGNHGQWDFWVIKLNSIGDTIWTRTYGDSYNEYAYSIQQTFDSGYIVAGTYDWTDSFPPEEDWWVIKLNNNGDTVWTKILGGTSHDFARSVQQTYDSGYIVAGYTWSNDGDVSGNHGSNDFWVVKLNSNGDTVWTKTYGGSSSEEAYSIQQTLDSGYVVAGYTYSNDGDVHANHGQYDFWVVKLNSSGDTLWTKTLGGLSFDHAFSVQQTNDGGYVIAGRTQSSDGDVHGNQGDFDLWVVKLNSIGDTLWTKTAGGTNFEEAKSVQQTFDNTYVIAGETESYDGDIYRNHGGSDFWVFELAEFPNHIYQTIPLLSGWNIMSFNVTPNDTNMLHIVQPLIDSSELIKVQDEAGGIIQNIPGIGWMNTIGDMANTEGYYTKVNANTQLQITGLPVALPYTIPLTTGWNIMGYPLQQSQDALTAVQQLIDDDELIKVLDESGGFIQDIPGIGWMNTIGDIEAGKGYYIKVTNNTSLTLDNSPVLFIGSPPIVQKQPQLFNVPKQNPYLPMNIIVTGINIEGFTVQNDDEVAVFDNNRLTGAGVITTGNKALTSFSTAMDDPTTTEIDGYIEGNIPAFRFKSANLNGSIQLKAKPVFGSLSFSPLGTLVCTLEGSITTIEEQKEKTFALKCVPNPANSYTNIQYQLPEEGQLQLEVYDLSSHRIAVLQSEQQSAGSHTYRFDAALLERGIYLIKIQLRTKDNQYTEVVKFVRN